jgi:light-regulated signal transduction histidine kinase (bacteriophytochrome)
LNYYNEFITPLELRAESQIKVLNVIEEYKSLIFKVSHDLTSPLGYLKFSTTILESQIKSNYDDNLKETSRVIASSTSKLSNESKTIIEEAKAKLESFSPKKIDIKKVCLGLMNHFTNQNIDLIIEHPILISHDAIYSLVVANLLYTIESSKLNLSKIHIEETQHTINIKFLCHDLTKDSKNDITTKFMKCKRTSIFESCYSRLEGSFDIFEKQNLIVLSLSMI